MKALCLYCNAVLFLLVKFGQNLLLAKFGSERVKRKSDKHRMIGWWFKNCFNDGLRFVTGPVGAPYYGLYRDAPPERGNIFGV